MQLSGTAELFDSFVARLGQGFNLSSAKLSMLLTTAEYAPSPQNKTVADINGEVDGSGYARQRLEELSIENLPGTFRVGFSQVVFKCSTGLWKALRWVIFSDDSEKALISHGLLDGSGAEVAVTGGNTLTITPQLSYFFELVKNG